MTPDGPLTRVTVRLTPAQIAWLDAFARTHDVSRSQALRIVLDTYAARYEVVIDERQPMQSGGGRP